MEARARPDNGLWIVDVWMGNFNPLMVDQFCYSSCSKKKSKSQILHRYPFPLKTLGLDSSIPSGHSFRRRRLKTSSPEPKLRPRPRRRRSFGPSPKHRQSHRPHLSRLRSEGRDPGPKRFLSRGSFPDQAFHAGRFQCVHLLGNRVWADWFLAC